MGVLPHGFEHRWLIELAETHPRAQQVDARTTIGSFLQHQGVAGFSLADVHIKAESPTRTRPQNDDREPDELVVDGMGLPTLVGPIPARHRVSLRTPHGSPPGGPGSTSRALGTVRDL